MDGTTLTQSELLPASDLPTVKVTSKLVDAATPTTLGDAATFVTACDGDPTVYASARNVRVSRAGRKQEPGTQGSAVRVAAPATTWVGRLRHIAPIVHVELSRVVWLIAHL